MYIELSLDFFDLGTLKLLNFRKDHWFWITVPFQAAFGVSIHISLFPKRLRTRAASIRRWMNKFQMLFQKAWISAKSGRTKFTLSNRHVSVKEIANSLSIYLWISKYFGKNEILLKSHLLKLKNYCSSTSINQFQNYNSSK